MKKNYHLDAFENELIFRSSVYSHGKEKAEISTLGA
jgi:hypothetical protein